VSKQAHTADTEGGTNHDGLPYPEDLLQKLEHLPAAPGVYLFKDDKGAIIYVGKAKSLRPRVRSYFQERGAPDPKRRILVSKIADLEIIVTDSEVEALLLENNLIKEHTPRYNVRLKDDKSYPYIRITNEPYPRVFPTRNRVRDGSRYFGPYTDVKAMKSMLRTIRSIFPIRSCDYHLTEETIAKKKVTLCLDYQIGKCDGPCEGLVSNRDYRNMIDQVERLLKGKTRALQRLLEQEMVEASESLEFEKAAVFRNRLNALKKYQERQKVVYTNDVDRDIVVMAAEDQDAVGLVFRVRDGKIVGKQHFTFTGAAYQELRDIIEILLQRYYSGTEDIPREIFLQDDIESAASLSEWLTEKAGRKVQVLAPRIGEKARLVKMSLANAKYLLDEIKLQRAKAETLVPRSITALQRDLRLKAPPLRIECFDISHTQGSETVASMVVFVDGKPRKREYRKYHVKSVEGVDDFASIKEIVGRRYRRVLDEGLPLPDLIVIDGGKGQLSSAVEALSALDLGSLPVIGLAKRLEEVFLPGESIPQNIPKTSSGLKLLQRIRDEAHRFAVTFHRSLREKRTLRTELEEIEGIGEKRARDLLETFGSVRGVQSAPVEDLANVVGWSAARNVYAHFHEVEETAEEATPDE